MKEKTKTPSEGLEYKVLQVGMATNLPDDVHTVRSEIEVNEKVKGREPLLVNGEIGQGPKTSRRRDGRSEATRMAR